VKLDWFKSLVSASDSRVSTLIVCLLTSLIFGLAMYYFRGTIGDSLVTIILSLIAAVSSVNISDRVIKYVSAKTVQAQDIPSNSTESIETHEGGGK
jgi:ABC-type dipeptide/oligopeptide/nickel transport system permease component